jgi:hypothetical protein
MKSRTRWTALFLLLAMAGADAAELRAGVAKGVITPERAVGRIGVMGGPLAGVHDDLHARVLTLFDGEARLVFVTYDLNCLDVATPILRVRLRDELGLPPAHFIPIATHNHSAPIQIVPDNFDYGRWLADRIFALVQEAVAAEAGPATVRFGSGYHHALMAVGNAPVDAEVQVLHVEVNGATRAVFFNQATHPLGLDENVVGTGHPGVAMARVEAARPGALALYGTACGGNQFSRYALMYTDAATVERMGGELAEVVLGVLNGETTDVTGPVSARLAHIDLPLAPPIPEPEARRLMDRTPIHPDFVPYPHKDRPTNWVRSLARHYSEGLPFPKWSTDLVCTDDGFLVHELPEAREFPCRYEETIVAAIGPLVFVAMQGEVCAPIGMRVKDTFRNERPIMVCAYMGEHNLYIPTRELVRQRAYQALVIQTQYASPVAWAPTVENVMVNKVRSLVREHLLETFGAPE